MMTVLNDDSLSISEKVKSVDLQSNSDSDSVNEKVKPDEFEPKEKRRILRNIVVVSFAFMLHFTAFQGANNLQSSINSDAGLGTASLATIYGALILSNLFLPVVMIRYLGCKWAVAVSFIGYMPYIAAQFHPAFYTMIPAAVLVGLGGGPLWCGKCTYLSVVAEIYSKISNIPTDTLTVRFFGIFFMFFQCSQIWGNLISSLVFSLNATDVQEAEGCGIDFCPSSDVVNNTNFEVPSQEKVYTVAGIYLGCMALAVCIVSIGLDSLKRYNEDDRQVSETELTGFKLLSVTVKLLKEPRQLILIPIIMWLGMEQGFVTADYTASYVACAWGIKNIGFVMICYGVCNSISAISTGSLVKITGRVPIVTCTLVIHIGIIITLFTWSPNLGQVPVFFVLSGLWGVCDGVWLVQINAMVGYLFPGRQEAAYSNLRLWQSVGFIIAYAYSSYLCTVYKTSILLALLIIGISGYYVVEWSLYKEKRIKLQEDNEKKSKF